MLSDLSKKKSKKTVIVNRTSQYRVGVFNNRCFCSFFFELFVEHFPENFLEKMQNFLLKRSSLRPSTATMSTPTDSSSRIPSSQQGLAPWRGSPWAKIVLLEKCGSGFLSEIGMKNGFRIFEKCGFSSAGDRRVAGQQIAGGQNTCRFPKRPRQNTHVVAQRASGFSSSVL